MRPPVVLVKPTKLACCIPHKDHRSTFFTQLLFLFCWENRNRKKYPLVICNIAIEAMANILVVSIPMNTMVILHTHLGLPEGRHLPYKAPMAQSK